MRSNRKKERKKEKKAEERNISKSKQAQVSLNTYEMSNGNIINYKNSKKYFFSKKTFK